jgi:gliding motility associated protien GldN
MKKYNLTVLALLICSLSFSQTVVGNEESTERMNNVYDRSQHLTRDVVPLSHLREADVMWSRKIWREIDLRQKINHPLYYPQESLQTDETLDRDNLFTALFNAAIGNGEVSIDAYDAISDDEFTSLLTPQELELQMYGPLEPKYLQKIDFYDPGDSLDVNGDKIVESFLRNEKNAIKQSDIVKWRIKELWFFDKQRSVMDVRIIGLAPLKQDRDINTQNLTGQFSPICWFYFQDARKVLKNSQAFNLVGNEAENKTFEDIFMKRMFSSTITKQGNVYNRKIDQYMIGLDALLEAESIKAEIFNIEHDLWEY